MRYLIIITIILCFGCNANKSITCHKSLGHKKVLIAVNIIGLKVVQFPKYSKDGEKWDAYAPFAEDADLYLSIKWNENVLYKSETQNECVYGVPVVFSQGLPFGLKPFDQPLMLEVFDEDGISSDDNVGYLTLNMLDFKNQHTWVVQSGELYVEFQAEWIYE